MFRAALIHETPTHAHGSMISDHLTIGAPMSKTGPDPIYDEAMQRTNVMLPPHLKAYAREIGKNISDGIRKALEEHMQERSNVKKE